MFLYTWNGLVVMKLFQDRLAVGTMLTCTAAALLNSTLILPTEADEDFKLFWNEAG